MNKNILIGLCYCLAGQILVWFQINSQFVWPGIKKYDLLSAIVIGPIVSLLFIYAVRFITEGSDGMVWPSRLIPNAMGIIIFTIMTWIFLKQGIEIKTGICIILSFLILAIQIYWK